MNTLFLVCTVVGGTILVLQLVLSLLGLGLDQVMNIGGELGDASADAVSGHANASTGGDLASDHLGAGDHQAESMTTHGNHQTLVYLGRLLTLQTILAFVTFFGIGGLGMLKDGHPLRIALLVAMLLGLAAMLCVAFLFSAMRRLQSDGTVHLSEAIGCPGSVYLTIPGDNTGIGKVFASVRGRELELAAQTEGPELRPGERIVVSGIVNSQTVRVVAAASYIRKPAPLV